MPGGWARAGAHALAGPEGDEPGHVRRQAATKRGQAEKDQTGGEDAPFVAHVAQAGNDEQQAGDHQDVAQDDPLDGGEIRVQVLGQGGQGHVDDAHVQRGHEHHAIDPEHGQGRTRMAAAGCGCERRCMLHKRDILAVHWPPACANKRDEGKGARLRPAPALLSGVEPLGVEAGTGVVEADHFVEQHHASGAAEIAQDVFQIGFVAALALPAAATHGDQLPRETQAERIDIAPAHHCFHRFSGLGEY